MNFYSEKLLQQVTSGFMQGATSATTKERILQQVTSEFSQQTVSKTSNEKILQRPTSRSNEWISRSNKQRVISYALSLL